MSLCLRLTTLAVTKANPGPITNTGSCSKECRPVSDVPRVSACEWDRRRILQSRYPGLQRPNVSTSFASVSFCDRYKRLAFWEVVLLQHFACPYSQMCTHPSMYPSRCWPKGVFSLLLSMLCFQDGCQSHLMLWIVLFHRMQGKNERVSFCPK